MIENRSKLFASEVNEIIKGNAIKNGKYSYMYVCNGLVKRNSNGW